MNEVIIKFLLAFVCSGLIGFEREVNESNAGIKTHILVGIGATLVALIQIEAVDKVIAFSQLHPHLIGVIRVDITRLIAQVISGIGFLGAGAIIVTKRKITGLTTAASLWTTAAIGLGFGMGFYQVALFACFMIVLTLFIFKRILKVHVPDRLVIKYIGGFETLSIVSDVFETLELKHEQISYNGEMFGDELIHKSIFKISGLRDNKFDALISTLMDTRKIISVEKTNLD